MSENKEIIDIELTEKQRDAILDELDEQPDIEELLQDERIIYLHGEITEDTVNQVVPMIHYYNALDRRNGIPKDERLPIKLYVRSSGGSVHEGMNIVTAIETSETPVWTINDGNIGYSMGFVIFIAGHRSFMSRHAFLLFHEISATQDVMTYSEMRNVIEHYRVMQDKLDKYIVERTKIPMKKLKEYRKRNIDWYIDYETAKKYEVFTDTL